MSQNRKVEPSESQRSNLGTLQKNFGLSDSEIGRCLFFSRDQDEPWIPADVQIKIAQRSDRFHASDPEYVTYVEALKQFIYKATVMDVNGRMFARIGVATLGEKPGGYDIDPHDLAQSRALNKALTDAQFNPFRSGEMLPAIASAVPRVPLNESERELQQITAAAAAMKSDMQAIHAEAEKKRLIIAAPGGKDMSRYRNWLLKHFGVHSAVLLNDEQRASAIALLNAYVDEDEFIQQLPEGLREAAAIA